MQRGGSRGRDARDTRRGGRERVSEKGLETLDLNSHHSSACFLQICDPWKERWRSCKFCILRFGRALCPQFYKDQVSPDEAVWNSFFCLDLIGLIASHKKRRGGGRFCTSCMSECSHGRLAVYSRFGVPLD